MGKAIENVLEFAFSAIRQSGKSVGLSDMARKSTVGRKSQGSPIETETAAYRAFISEKPSAIAECISEASRLTKLPKPGSYDATGKFDEKEAWFPVSGLARKEGHGINRCRLKLLEAEAYMQFSGRFVTLMEEQGAFTNIALPPRKGEFPMHRVAMDQMTMLTCHELYLMKLVSGQPGIVDYNMAMAMAERYFIDPNTAMRYLEYQALVMIRLGLWKVETDGARFKTKPGDWLEKFIKGYWDCVNWAENTYREFLLSIPDAKDGDVKGA